MCLHASVRFWTGNTMKWQYVDSGTASLIEELDIDGGTIS